MNNILANYQQRYRALIDNHPDGIIQFDAQGRCIYVNEVISNITELSAFSMLGKKLCDWPIYAKPELLQLVDDATLQVIATSARNSIEFTWPNGIISEIRYVPEFNNQGDVSHVLAIVRDITQQQKMKHQLEQREQEFRTLVENTPENIARYDRDGRLLYINPQLEDFARISLAEVQGKTLLEISPPWECDELHEVIKEVIASGEDAEYDFTPIDKSEDYHYHIHLTPERDEFGTICGALLFGHDVTDIKRTKQKLEHEKMMLKTFFNTLPDIVWVKDLNGKFIDCNTVLENFFGIPRVDIIGKTDNDITDSEQAAFFIQKDKEAIAAGKPTTNEEWLTASSGQRVLFETTKTPVVNKNGKVIGVLGISHEITKLKEVEAQLRTLLDNNPDVIIRYDREFRRVYVNSEYEKMMGLNAIEVLGKVPDETSTTVQPSINDYHDLFHKLLDSGKPERLNIDWFNSQGQKVTYDTRAIPEYNSDGIVASVLVVARELTDTENLLKTKELEYRTLVENSPDLIVRYDLDCRRTFVNQAYLVQMGTSTECALKSSVDNEIAWLPTIPHEEYFQRLQDVMKTGEPDNILLEWERFDGQHVSHEMHVVAEYDAKGTVIGTLAIGRNVTRSKQVEQQLHHQARFDSLTELPNRRLFHERLHQDITFAENNGERLGLLFIDLDRFKIVNDTMGHEAGDKLLVEMAKRIKDCVRDTDTVARLAGDEFVVILPTNGEMHSLERVVHSIINSIELPFHFKDHHMHISVGIGIAVYPIDANNAEALLSCADQAMYAAKKLGPNHFSFYDHDMLINAKKRIKIANELYNALKNKELEVYYQPIIDVATGQIFKAEALLRWHHPELGMVPPDLFIPLAEETDLIQSIGNWVFFESVELAKRWNILTSSEHIKQISVNMSPRQFQKGEADQQIIHYMQTNDHNPAHIAIEITEGLLLDDSLDIALKLDRLRDAGFDISLDDFGTGYSALSYLKKFNIDYLKIDRSFVKDIESDPAAQAIAEAIVVMAHRLGLKVIAEGIETPEQYESLATMGCEYMQGYLFAKPMPLEEFLTFVDEENYQTQPKVG